MVRAEANQDDLKKSCTIDLTYPFHFDQEVSDRLAALQDHLSSQPDSDPTSALETELSSLFGKPAALWCPSGTMAQGIAARIYAERGETSKLLLHPTSHLLLHEEESYRALHGLSAVEVGEWRESLRADMLQDDAACAIIELPQRHSGGLLPSWEELTALKERARDLNLPLHIDGARIWSCRHHYGDRTYAEILEGISSVYVSFYKDIGAAFGAALVGDQDFIDEARLWLARMGGQLVDSSLLTADTVRLLDLRLPQIPKFIDKAKKLAATLASIPTISISPATPQVNMFHVMLPCSADVAEHARNKVAEKQGVWLSNRFWNYEGPNICAMELTVGEKAISLSTEAFKNAVELLLTEIHASR